jgi:signal transduction histidine kinase
VRQHLARLFRRAVEPIRALADMGVSVDLPDPLKKRIRLTNAVSLLGAFVMLASIPFDYEEAPRWMVLEDLLGGIAYLGLPWLNRRGRLTLSRLLCIALSNLIVLGNAAFLGNDSGAPMIFIALCAIPFTLFDLRDRGPIAFGALLAIGCFVVAQSGALAHLQSVSANYSASIYTVYSATVTFVALLFALYQTSVANARAEEALRQDIQERLRAERELELTRQSSIYGAKMAALGEMSGNIAHEVNNPLTAIVLRAQLLRRRIANDQGNVAAAVDKAVVDIETTAERIRRIVDALRIFARDAEGDPMRSERVIKIVQDTIDLCAQRFQHHGVELVVDPIPEDLVVECRAIQISQILLNLLSNAYDAVAEQAVRWVRITVDPVNPGDRDVRIAVMDSGPGIPPELEAHIMTPFFTTKDVGKGTGLGLSVSKGIAEAHNGRLAYDPTSRQTRFVLTLVQSPTADIDALAPS